MVDEAADAGFNALFVQVRGRGDAFYRSAIVPRSTLLERQPREFDPLARLIARARARRLQVHAWVNVLLSCALRPAAAARARAREAPRVGDGPALAWPRRRSSRSGARRLRLIMDAGRDARATSRATTSRRPIPEVGDHLEAVVRELVRGYAVDGLHLDFIRYPGPAFDYSRGGARGLPPGRAAGRDLARRRRRATPRPGTTTAGTC